MVRFLLALVLALGMALTGCTESVVEIEGCWQITQIDRLREPNTLIEMVAGMQELMLFSKGSSVEFKKGTFHTDFFSIAYKLDGSRLIFDRNGEQGCNMTYDILDNELILETPLTRVMMTRK